MEDRWLSVAEIATYLGVVRDSVYRWVERKNMPAHRLGRRWKFRRDEVDEWVRSGGADDRDSRDDLTDCTHATAGLSISDPLGDGALTIPGEDRL